MENIWLLAIFVATCLFTDLTDRKIYNSVILSGIICALCANIFHLNITDGIIFTMTGLFTGIFLLILPFIFGGMGAGDVKMLGMIGAFIGHERVIEVMLASAVVGGVIALVLMFREGRLLGRVWKYFLAYSMVILTRKTTYLNTLDSRKRKRGATIPYGAAISSGVVIIYILGSLNYTILGMPLF